MPENTTTTGAKRINVALNSIEPLWVILVW